MSQQEIASLGSDALNNSASVVFAGNQHKRPFFEALIANTAAYSKQDVAIMTDAEVLVIGQLVGSTRG